MRVSVRVKQALVGMVLGMLGMAAPSLAQGLPDVVGIKPGMSAQEAYNALKARANGAKIGIGQLSMPTITDKPVVVIMSVRALDVSPAEIITVWLTLPPNAQQVWAIRRTLQFETGKPVLKSTVMDGLKQKYGAETKENALDYFWTFNEQGSQLRGNNCAARLSLSGPDDPPNVQGSTPLIYLPEPENACSGVISVRTEFGGVTSGAQDMVGQITVVVEDTPLARRSQLAYQAALANAGAAQQKRETDGAKQQKTPTF